MNLESYPGILQFKGRMGSLGREVNTTEQQPPDLGYLFPKNLESGLTLHHKQSSYGWNWECWCTVSSDWEQDLSVTYPHPQ